MEPPNDVSLEPVSTQSAFLLVERLQNFCSSIKLLSNNLSEFLCASFLCLFMCDDRLCREQRCSKLSKVNVLFFCSSHLFHRSTMLYGCYLCIF